MAFVHRVPGRSTAAMLGLLVGFAIAVPAARADDGPSPPPAGLVHVPDVRRLAPEAAARRLVAAGLNPGRVYEVAVPASWRLGLVVQQAPAPSTRARPGFLPRGGSVALAVAAREDGPSSGRPAPGAWPRWRPAEPVRSPAAGPAPTRPGTVRRPASVSGPAPPPPPPPPPPSLLPSEAPGRAAPDPLPAAPDPGRPQEAPGADLGPPPATTVDPPPPLPPRPEPAAPVVPPPAEPEAHGSPDAPADAPPPDPDRVPALEGLPLVDAEQRAHDCGLSLHVERVAGHPLSAVLEQEPAAGSPRPAGGLVRVVVAAGGDLPAALAPAPRVEVKALAVPDLLDRTGPQAERILEAMGFVPRLEPTDRGPPGRVADQQPMAGEVRSKGSTVVVRIAVAPPAAARPAPAPGPAPESRSSVGDGRVGTPLALAPSAGTDIGPGRSVALAFMWRAVDGADAYRVEIEERGTDGWLPVASQTVRRTAVALDVERVGAAPGLLRWRVQAIRAGRRGEPSGWVELR